MRAIAALALLLAAAPAAAQEITTVACTIADGGRLDAPATCGYFEDGPILDIKGTLTENGTRFTAIVDNSKSSGLLIGAGTYFLADGPIETGAAGTFVWENGYAITLADE